MEWGSILLPKAFMDKFRERIVAQPDRFLKTIAFLKNDSRFIVEGERYKKKRYDNISDEIIAWVQYKSFFLTSNHQADGHLFSEQLIEELITGFEMLAPLYSYLWELI